MNMMKLTKSGGEKVCQARWLTGSVNLALRAILSDLGAPRQKQILPGNRRLHADIRIRVYPDTLGKKSDVLPIIKLALRNKGPLAA